MTLTADKTSSKDKPDQSTWLEQMLQQHWNRVYAVVYRLLGDDEAEDLALEAFWRLHQHQPRELDENSLNGWLYRVAMNLGFNALRARQRRQHYEHSAGAQALTPGVGEDPESQLDLTLEQQRVRRALDQMKPRSARLLLLRYSGMSYAEIASVLDVSPGSVGTLLARAEREFEQMILRFDRQQDRRD